MVSWRCWELFFVTFTMPLIAGAFAGRKTSRFGLYAVIHSYRPVCFSCFAETLIGVRRSPEPIETRRTDGRGCFLLLMLTWNSFFFNMYKKCQRMDGSATCF